MWHGKEYTIMWKSMEGRGEEKRKRYRKYKEKEGGKEKTKRYRKYKEKD